MPYAAPARHVPNYGTLGELLGARAQSSGQGWAQLAQVFDRFVQTKRAEQAQAATIAQRQSEQQAEAELKRQEMLARREEAKATNARLTKAEERAQRGEERSAALDALENTTAGPIAPDAAATLRKYAGTAPMVSEQQTLEAKPWIGEMAPQETYNVRGQTPQEKRQAALDAHARAVAEKADADRRADNARMEAGQRESAHHNRVMETKEPRPLALEVVQGPNGPLLVDKQTGRSRPILGPDNQPIKTAMSAQERMDSRKFSKAAPVLSGIGELSEKINTQQGVIAKISGETERQKAKINLNDDVAEYESLISGFTPMIARALGHTGVLTQQDVDSVKALFPRPGDSKSLRDRKINRMMGIIGALEGVEGVDGVSPATKPDKKNPNR